MIATILNRAGQFVTRENAWARLLRIASIYGTTAGIAQTIDRYFPNTLPANKLGFALYILVGLSLSLSVELWLAHRDLSRANFVNSGRPDEDFARSLVLYAESLATSKPPRDQALMELRHWSSRLLHLNGNHKERAAVGQLALGAAAAAGDTLTQASILIDDLGWGLHVQGLSAEARENIEEAIGILAASPSSEASSTAILELQVKAKRHLAGINFARSTNIASAREELKSLRNQATALPESCRSLHLAQLDHTEAAFILRHLSNELGPSGVVDPTGNLASLHQDGLTLSATAEASFCNCGDIERQVKALKVNVELLRHGRQISRIHSAESRLTRLQAIASRRLTD
jgi:hypothetical protein